MFFSKQLTALGSLAAVANAHMLMATPARFDSPAATNGPIDSSSFPCQSSGGSFSGSATEMALGSDQPLSFTGQATHGGGSCQVSISYDESPTSSSTWKVITSIEGGCVAQGEEGNMGDNSDAADPYTYNFTIPDNIPTGKATIAWTWFNKVGNREMYMNCGAIELTGTSGDQSNYDSLPDMFQANLGDGCGTVSDTDVLFPDPGDVVQKLNGQTTAFADPTGCSSGSGSGSGATATATAGGSGSAATTQASSGSGSDSGSGGGVFATVGGSTAESTSEASAPAATGSTASSDSSSDSSSGSSSSSSSSSSSGSGSEESGACSDEGDYVCLSGGSTYQVCASGQWSAAMAVSSGTQCSGSGSSFSITTASSKRMFRKTRAERKKRGLGLMM